MSNGGRHENALDLFGGYCRTMTTAEILAEIEQIIGLRNSDSWHGGRIP